MPSDTTPPPPAGPTNRTAMIDSKAFTVCVFCGASPGSNPSFLHAARSLARVLSQNKWSLVYGGGTVGLMGALASTLVSLGGKVHGIVPGALIQRELDGELPPESEFGRTTVVKDMHTRKAMMGREANAFVAMPGGYGTMEELFEVITWNQLGIHDCPVVVLNVDGFYDGLLQWVDKAVDCGLISKGNRAIVVEAKTVEEVAEKIKNYKPAEDRFHLDWTAQ